MAPKRERTLFCQKDLHRNKMSISLYASPSEFMLKKKTYLTTMKIRIKQNKPVWKEGKVCYQKE